jgi:hypothetical protein
MHEPPFPPEVRALLAQASDSARSRRANDRHFAVQFFSPEWNAWIEHWAPIIHDFVGHALGPFGREPLPEILKMHDAEHSAGATASFEPATGQIRLSTSVEGKAGQTLEKLTHEMIHGSLAQFPEGDPFYEEGEVDYSVWVLAHAPVWGEHRDDMIEAAAFNIKMRRERAMRVGSDWDRKRWAGGLHASLAYGPFIIARLKHKKMEGDYTW